MSQMQPPTSQTYRSAGSQQTGQRVGMGQQSGRMQGVGIQQGQTPASSRFFPTQNYLSEQVRTTTVELLNQTLTDTIDLLTQVKAAHWNVKGPNFYSLHLLFDEIAEDLEEHADDIAERATALGGEAKATARIAASKSRIPELPPDPVAGHEFVQVLADRLAIHDANLGEGIRFASQQDDLDTTDLLNEVSREVTKNLWFLEAHLQTQPAFIGAGGQQPMGGGQQPIGQQIGGQMGQQFGGQPGGQIGQGQQFGGQQQPQGPMGRQQW